MINVITKLNVSSEHNKWRHKAGNYCILRYHEASRSSLCKIERNVSLDDNKWRHQTSYHCIFVYQEAPTIFSVHHLHANSPSIMIIATAVVVDVAATGFLRSSAL
jgi:hypothetical protein